MLLLIVHVPIRSQESFLRVTGRNSAKLQVAKKQNPYQEINPVYWEWESEPILTIGKFPIAFYLLLSSERQEFRQNINAITGLFSPENMEHQIRQRLIAELEKLEQSPDIQQLASQYDAVRDSLAAHDPEKLAQVEKYRKLLELQKLSGEQLVKQSSSLSSVGLISSFERILMNFPQIEIGTVYPQFLNPLAISGVAVNGVGVNWQPGQLRTAFVLGTTREPILSTDSTIPSVLGQRLYGFQLGWQTSSSNFFSLALVFGKDDVGSLADTVSVDQQNPQATNVLDFRFAQDLLESRFQLNGEVALSISTWNLNSPLIEDSPFPEWLTQRLSLRTSSFWDYAYKAEASVNLPEMHNRMSFLTQMTGPGYYSLGNPSIRRDYRSYGIRLQQQLVKRRISLAASYLQERDNLLETKQYTTETERIGAQLGFRFPRVPFFMVMLNRINQDFQNSRNTSLLWRVQSSYAYRVSELTNFTSIAYGQQRYEYEFRTLLHQLTFFHTVSFSFPLQMNANLTAIIPEKTAADTVSKRILQFLLGGSYNISPQFLLALAAGYGTEADMSHYTVQADLQYRLGKFGTIYLSAVARPFQNPNYSEYYLQLRLEQQWD